VIASKNAQAQQHRVWHQFRHRRNQLAPTPAEIPPPPSKCSRPAAPPLPVIPRNEPRLYRATVYDPAAPSAYRPRSSCRYEKYTIHQPALIIAALLGTTVPHAPAVPAESAAQCRFRPVSRRTQRRPVRKSNTPPAPRADLLSARSSELFSGFPNNQVNDVHKKTGQFSAKMKFVLHLWSLHLSRTAHQCQSTFIR